MTAFKLTSLATTGEKESKFVQLRTLFLMLEGINFNGNYNSDYSPAHFIARARDVIINEGHGFGNVVTVTVHNKEANLKANIEYVGSHSIPEHADELEHFNVKLFSTFGNSKAAKVKTTDEVYQFILESVDEVLPTFAGELASELEGMTKGRVYSYKKAIFNGKHYSLVKTLNDAGEQVLVEEVNFSVID